MRLLWGWFSSGSCNSGDMDRWMIVRFVMQITYPQTKNKTYAHITLQFTMRIGTIQIAVASTVGSKAYMLLFNTSTTSMICKGNSYYHKETIYYESTQK